MWSNIIFVCGFVVLLIIACIIWNRLMMRSYMRMKSDRERSDIENVTYINIFSELKLAGVESDNNSDYPVERAIANIDLPEDLRITP